MVRAKASAGRSCRDGNCALPSGTTSAPLTPRPSNLRADNDPVDPYEDETDYQWYTELVEYLKDNASISQDGESATYVCKSSSHKGNRSLVDVTTIEAAAFPFSPVFGSS